MKVLFDDTGYYISFQDDIKPEFKCICINQFNECIDILLTERQKYQFIAFETYREFNVSEKKIAKVFEYMKDNIWNFKNQYSGKQE